MIDDEPTRAIATTQPEPLNPLMLMQQAIDRGVDPAALKQLVDLQEQWRSARAKEAFAVAMNAVQIEMPCIVRDAENKHTQSRYVLLETLIHQVRPVYTKHGFSLSFSEGESKIGGWHRHICLVRHIDGHSESHYIDLPVDGVGAKGGKSSMNEVQGAISAGTYGQRILTCRVFNIVIADSDLDGAAPNPPANPTAPKAQPRAKRQEPEYAVTKEQMAHLAAFWKTKNTDPDGNVERQRAKLSEWIVEVSGRGNWTPKNPAEWRIDDYIAGCRALNIEPEGIE